MTQRTHWDECWKSGPEHYECAVGEVERLREYAQERALLHSQSLEAAEAEVERLRHDIERHMALLTEFDNEVEQLRAERAALRVDAERYRWLRQNAYDSRVTEKDGFGGYCLKYDYYLDAAIDAARGES